MKTVIYRVEYWCHHRPTGNTRRSWIYVDGEPDFAVNVLVRKSQLWCCNDYRYWYDQDPRVERVDTERLSGLTCIHTCLDQWQSYLWMNHPDSRDHKRNLVAA